MTRIEVNSSFGLGFDQVSVPVDVYDEKGRKLGQFLPYEDPMASCPYSEEELQAAAARARANPGEGKTLSQIWKDLGQDELSRAVDCAGGRSTGEPLDHSRR